MSYADPVRNRHKVLEDCRAAGIALTKQLKTWTVTGELVVLEVDRPISELLEELHARKQ